MSGPGPTFDQVDAQLGVAFRSREARGGTPDRTSDGPVPSKAPNILLQQYWASDNRRDGAGPTERRPYRHLRQLDAHYGSAVVMDGWDRP
jgi:hypothetical protein